MIFFPGFHLSEISIQEIESCCLQLGLQCTLIHVYKFGFKQVEVTLICLMLALVADYAVKWANVVLLGPPSPFE